jgi:DNA-binding CsgD family transcriptional regulator
VLHWWVPEPEVVAMGAELVGREAELAVLTDSLAAALDGHPQVVVCEGEAGIGKTRLAQELVGVAELRGVLWVWGSAAETPGAPPFWPWCQVLRALGRRVDLEALAGEHRLGAELARIAPDVVSAEPPPAASGSAEDRFRQFDAVARLLREVCLQAPLLVVLDDAHWADEASLLLLHHVTRVLTDERLLVVVNARDTERGDDARLARIGREPVTRRIQLRGLAPPAIRRQLASVLGREVDEREVLEAEALTGGNPFFVGEVALAIADRRQGGHVLPATSNVQGAIAARLGRLSPDCVRLLEAAAIVGRGFSVAVVASMLDRPVLGCLALVDEARAARLVAADGEPDGYRFVHALVRDAIERALGTVDRVRLHRLAADAIEQHHGARSGPQVFELARHWAVAAVVGERARAAGWIRRAAEEAMRRLAYEEAARLFRQTLDIGGAELAGEDRCALLLAAGTAAQLSADLGGRLDACLEAAEVARALGRPDLLAEAALVMEPVGRPGFDLATRRLCEEAAAALGSEPGSLRVRVTARLAESFAYLREIDRAWPASEHALALAEQSGDPLAVAAALRARQLVCSGPDGLDERAQLADRMLALGRQTRQAGVEVWARLWRIDAWFERGDLGRVASEIDALARCVREIQGPRERFEVLRCQAALAQAQARFLDARRLADEAFAVMAPSGHPGPYAVRAAIANLVGRHVGQDDASVAANNLVGASEEIHESFGLIGRLSYAHALVTAGRPEDAAEVYRSLGPVSGWGPLPHLVLFSYAFGIAVAVPLGLSADLAALYDRLDPFRGHHVVSGAGAVAYFGPVELWVGIAAHHLGRHDAAVTDLERAAQACQHNGAVGFEVEADVELAAVLARRHRPGDADRARSLASRAANQAATLGMSPFVDRTKGLRAQLSAVESEPLRLTRRELEVAELVGQGLTNREIARRLVLSERTAQNHVQHILTKLGLANRSQVAVWVNSRKLSMPAE